MESPFNLTSVISATKDGDSKAEFEFPDHEYMKLDSTKLKTEKTKSNKEITSVEKKLVEQAESLRRLAILYVLLAVGIVITFATFGTFTHVMVSKCSLFHESACIHVFHFMIENKRKLNKHLS